MNQKLFLGTLAVSLVLIAGLWSFTRATSGEIFGCVARDGVLTLIGQGSRKENCKRTETAISWNAQGEKGEQGDKGDKGDPGEPGQQATSTIGAGDFAFINYDDFFSHRYVLKRDGTVWRCQITFGVCNNWTPRPSLNPPIPVTDIVQWETNFLLDKNGFLWHNNAGSWQKQISWPGLND